MTLPKEIYVWNENQTTPDVDPLLNINSDGSKPDAATVEDSGRGRGLRVGVYRLAHEAEITVDTKEIPVKEAVS